MASALEKIDYAALKTLEAHPEFRMADNIEGYVYSRFDPTYFTSKDGARAALMEVSENEFIYELGKFAFMCSDLYVNALASDKEDAAFMRLGKLCYDFVNFVSSKKINPFLFLKANIQYLRDVARCFGYYRFDHFEEYGKLICKYNIIYDGTFDRAYEDASHVHNVKVRHRNINKCHRDVLTGKQFQLSHAEYSLDGNVFAVSDIGRERGSQEDAVLMLNHPDNSSYKLIAVADGMGGEKQGEVASNETLKLLSEWFEKLDVSVLDNPEELNPIFANAVSIINNKIFEKLKGEGGTTLSVAIVCNGVTFVASIGDSRIYLLRNTKLEQVCEDDSYVYNLYKAGEIKYRDDMRFHKESNVIMKGIGTHSQLFCTDMHFIKDYDLLMIFSDGVTDCLSDDEIKIFAIGEKPQKLAREIVKFAKFHDSKRINKNDDELYNDVIHGGKDNLTAAVFYPGRKV